MRLALRSDRGTNVPCGDCRGCCVSSYHIPIRVEDRAARVRVPQHWIVTASGRLMMGFRDDGRCPMLGDDRTCTIYEFRPQACRDYDCRIFAAAGIDAGGADKVVINTRVHEWVFDYPTEEDRRTHEAVRAAATFIREKRDFFPGNRAPTAPTGIAVLAIKSYGVFLDAGAGERIAERSDEDIARAIVDASRAFDAAEH
jgi:uncharacterized protein